MNRANADLPEKSNLPLHFFHAHACRLLRLRKIQQLSYFLDVLLSTYGSKKASIFYMVHPFSYSTLKIEIYDLKFHRLLWPLQGKLFFEKSLGLYPGSFYLRYYVMTVMENLTVLITYTLTRSLYEAKQGYFEGAYHSFIVLPSS